MADGQVAPMAHEIAALGMSYKAAIAGGIGGAVGSVLGRGRWWERVARSVVGTMMAYVGHHVTAKILVGVVGIAIADPHLPTVAEMEPVAAFLIGLVGMVACQAAINAMTAVRDHADDYVEHKLEVDK